MFVEFVRSRFFLFVCYQRVFPGRERKFVVTLKRDFQRGKVNRQATFAACAEYRRLISCSSFSVPIDGNRGSPSVAAWTRRGEVKGLNKRTRNSDSSRSYNCTCCTRACKNKTITQKPGDVGLGQIAVTSRRL